MPYHVKDTRYQTALWRKIRLQVLRRDRFTCHLCGRSEPPANSADHLKAAKLGNEDEFYDMGNLKAAHQKCNEIRGSNATPEEARARLLGLEAVAGLPHDRQEHWDRPNGWERRCSHPDCPVASSAAPVAGLGEHRAAPLAKPVAHQAPEDVCERTGLDAEACSHCMAA